MKSGRNDGLGIRPGYHALWDELCCAAAKRTIAQHADQEVCTPPCHINLLLNI